LRHNLTKRRFRWVSLIWILSKLNSGNLTKRRFR
jgi:hypothetical protein